MWSQKFIFLVTVGLASTFWSYASNPYANVKRPVVPPKVSPVASARQRSAYGGIHQQRGHAYSSISERNAFDTSLQARLTKALLALHQIIGFNDGLSTDFDTKDQKKIFMASMNALDALDIPLQCGSKPVEVINNFKDLLQRHKSSATVNRQHPGYPVQLFRTFHQPPGQTMPRYIVDRIDSNNDGFVSVSEYARSGCKMPDIDSLVQLFSPNSVTGAPPVLHKKPFQLTISLPIQNPAKLDSAFASRLVVRSLVERLAFIVIAQHRGLTSCVLFVRRRMSRLFNSCGTCTVNLRATR